MKKLIIIAILACFVSMDIVAQDPFFSQYYQVPSYLNPSMTGNFNGLYKIGVNYRDQWRPALSKPYATFAATGESKFNLGNKRNPDVAALGIMFFSDKISRFDLNTTQIALSGSYHKLLNFKSNSYLGIGYQVGIMQKSLNYEDLNFGDQFNAIDAYSNSTLEILPVNNFGFFDMSLGIDYSINPSSNYDFNVGAALFHFNTPDVSFFNKEETPDKDLDLNASLDSRFVLHASLNLPIHTEYHIEPRVLFMKQDMHRMFSFTPLVKFDSEKTEAKVFYFGPSLRFSNRLSSITPEAIALIAGIDVRGFNIGFSYDHNLSDLVFQRDGLGTFELTLNYFGRYENEDTFCPKF